MACCDNIIKCLLFLVNFVFTLSGLAIITVGAILYNQYKDFDRILDSAIASPPIIMLVIGTIIFLVAFYGCCGAIMESHCMLITYGVVLILIFVAQVSVGVVALINGKDTLDVFTKGLQKEFDATGSDKASYDLFYALQTQLHCCGVNGPSDYSIIPTNSLFQSCCSDTVKTCVVATYREGCAQTLANFIDDNATIVGGVGIGIAVIEILGAIAGFSLASWVKKQY